MLILSILEILETDFFKKKVQIGHFDRVKAISRTGESTLPQAKVMATTFQKSKRCVRRPYRGQILTVKVTMCYLIWV